MTEEEWLTCTEHRTLLDHLRFLRMPGPVRWLLRFWAYDAEGLSPRKYQLAQEALQTCQVACELIEDQGVVVVTEFFLDQVREVGRYPITSLDGYAVEDQVIRPPNHPELQFNSRTMTMMESAMERAKPELCLPSAAIVRDVFGNPFRPVSFEPPWRSETAVALATAIYADRAFDRMPILADALEEAGCDHADILAHCRGPGPHARGCWVVDLVLGKV